MKKQWILIIAISLGTSLAMAGTFQADDFNEMIRENQKLEKDLRKQLQKEAGIVLDSDRPGTVAKEKIQAPAAAQEIVVSSSTNLWKEKKDKSDKLQHKADMKRISQELDEAFSN